MLKVRLLVWLAVFGLAAWLLPWWAAALVGALGPAWVFQPWRGSLDEGIARSRGFPLREASVQIEALVREVLDTATHRLALELLIRPRPGNARLRPWWPGEFRFAPDVGRAVSAESCELKSGREWKSGIDAVTGEQHLRFFIDVPASAANVTLRYFREELAHIDLGNDAPTMGKLPGA